MKLAYTTEAFSQHGVLMPGVPGLLNPSDPPPNSVCTGTTTFQISRHSGDPRNSPYPEPMISSLPINDVSDLGAVASCPPLASNWRPSSRLRDRTNSCIQSSA